MEDQSRRVVRCSGPLLRPDDEVEFTFKERRDEEDELSATRYADLPLPGKPAGGPGSFLLARGVIDEEALRERLAAVRARLEAD